MPPKKNYKKNLKLLLSILPSLFQTFKKHGFSPIAWRKDQNWSRTRFQIYCRFYPRPLEGLVGSNELFFGNVGFDDGRLFPETTMRSIIFSNLFLKSKGLTPNPDHKPYPVIKSDLDWRKYNKLEDCPYPLGDCGLCRRPTADSSINVLRKCKQFLSDSDSDLDLLVECEKLKSEFLIKKS